MALVEARLFESRAKAQEAITAGLVRVDGRVARRPSDRVGLAAQLEAEPPYPWVSRGGLKLVAALEHFDIDPAGRVCLDVGASTGGFTDVLLARGATRVHAVDVGREQLHLRLKSNSRVDDLSETDIRQLAPGSLDPAPSLVVCDASFISLTLILPAMLALATRSADLVTLIKPQFEVGMGQTRKGIVRDETLRRAACDRIVAEVVALGWRVQDVVPSPITGRDGNIEYLLGATRP